MIAQNQIYFIGIGGIGMSAFARYYKVQGFRVAGSDVAKSPITAALQKEGIAVKIGHGKDNIKSNAKNHISLVIYGRAIPSDNPELLAARKIGLRILPYAEALGELTEEYPTIAITGSHGKSTTTAIAGLALIAGGLDPTVLVGTNLKEFGGENLRIGKTDGKNKWLVLEADDFGGAFWSYSPLISIVTNIDREHLDFYKNLTGVKKAFLKFIVGTVPGGTLILNHDDENLSSLKSKIGVIARTKKLRVVWYSIRTSRKNSNQLLNSRAEQIKGAIKIFGTHNLSNAMAVYELGILLKIPEKKILAAIGTYHGAWRRMEYRGNLKLAQEAGGWGKKDTVTVYDDYAHHPTEIKATLQGFREEFPHTPIVCVFQPHQAKRLKALFKEFTDAFNAADILVLIPSYTVAGRDDVKSKFTAKRLADAIQKKNPHKPVFYVRNPRDIKKFLSSTLFSASHCCYEACLVMMGAGDIVQHTDSLLAD